jgi:DNA topoisomerase-1
MTILLIVESPAKAKTISKYLGKEYIIKASYGHIRDLEKNKIGIDIENNFKPNYKIIPLRSKQVKELQEAAKKVDKIYLAADEDREGEAIAYHVAHVLKLNIKENNRITFHEITKSAVETAIQNPRQINMNMVNSQQARRILDRLVGFKLSPILWKYVCPKLSAGRVQSVCLKLIIEKENDITKFTSSSQFKIKGFFNKEIIAQLNKHFEKKEDALEFLNSIKNSLFKIVNIEKKIEEKKPYPPYTTSTVVQDINSRFHINPKMAMMCLQKLYEKGKITYHRTDSTNLCEQISSKIKEYVINKYTAKYYKKRIYKSSQKNAQEAHEAIRPTNISEDELISNNSESSHIEKKIYRLIWSRTVASQMSNAIFEKNVITISISNRDELFITNIIKKIFDGFTILYDVTDNSKDDELIIKVKEELKKGEDLSLVSASAEEKYQNPPPRYTDGTLVKKMEKLGIGRPSTYANIIETILERKYINRDNIDGVSKLCTILTMSLNKLKQFDIKETNNKILLGAEKNKLIPTPLGITTNNFLNKNFDEIMEYDFTSNLENNLDKICDGTVEWNNVIKTFYDKFVVNINKLAESDTIQDNKQFKLNADKRIIGIKEDKPYYIYTSKFGPVIQIGENNDKDKQYINLDKKTDISKFQIEDLDHLDVYPKNMGKYKEINVYIKKSKYGKYIEYNKENYKLDEKSNEEMTLENIINCIESQNSAKESSINIGKYSIKNGKYGYYTIHNKKLVGLPKDMKIDDITEEIITELLNRPVKKFYKSKK